MECQALIDPKTGIALERDALVNASRTAGAVCCGYELEPDDIFCPSCGARVVEATTAWWMFSGRATRKEYWNKILKIFLINIGFLVCLGIFVVCGGDLDDSETIIIGVMGFISNIALLPVSVRRLHDLGDSGWLLTVSPCLSIVGVVLTSIPIEWFQLWCSLFLFVASCSFGLVLFVLMGFKRGTRGLNKYGPAPKVDSVSNWNTRVRFWWNTRVRFWVAFLTFVGIDYLRYLSGETVRLKLSCLHHDDYFFLFLCLLSIGAFVYFIIMSVQRLHDMNRSGWWIVPSVCLVIIATVAPVVSAIMESDSAVFAIVSFIVFIGNLQMVARFVIEGTFAILFWIALIGNLGMVAWLGFARGTTDPNPRSKRYYLNAHNNHEGNKND